ncbi:hypothetical protein EGJ22_21345 [Pseudomonas sp. p99-361]|uniref:hypothetical protein n=1 Tax=Pseudomonas sp. p99-361 TaxID=2479852 RepID=UPI000F77554B|nr:hypothetical protein [Pseudomonas sp. p99-361]RRV08721.1 hypothetical protein EGJ22_21345 [Pseudomonas sp. p99-361]
MKEDGKAVSLLKKGSGIAGASVGSVVSALIGAAVAGPAGTTAGAAVAKACEFVIEDIAHRMLSSREQQKVGGVAALAIDGIRERLLWDSPRKDGFFERKEDDQPSPCEEIFEGVLLAAKQEHERKKLEYVARFFTNLVFTPDFQPAEANHLIAIAETLTYQQFCILAVVANRDAFALRSEEWPERGVIPTDKLDLAHQAFYLYQRQFLVSIDPQQGQAGFVYNIARTLPTHCHLSPTGLRIVDILGLRDIPRVELEEVAGSL